MSEGIEEGMEKRIDSQRIIYLTCSKYEERVEVNELPRTNEALYS